ncbi:MAG TPA: dTDP-glucose 4,6-dehydratase [Desulfotomaculum sp.]|nr:MAG: spore coat protein [Desulfotomaculum sp. BICA1-6]HBX23506.1 dTDP-glucose 4,6-dehydratase [Desulfotomaculum sp.]
MNKVLVTGGAGFIGSNFIHYMLERYDNCQITNVDLLTYAGNLDNLSAISNDPRYQFIKADIVDFDTISSIVSKEYDSIINFAAESHVDRSIDDPGIFVRTNVLGTQSLLEAAHRFGVKKFVQVSTDEVYGSLGPEGYFIETTPLNPSSPYSASKTAADHLVMAYGHTFGQSVNITRCSNNYGPFQFPEKLIPLIVTNALSDKPLPVYGDGMNVRDWLHVKDHCRAIDMVMRQAKTGEIYNIGGNNERTNIDIVKTIVRHLNKTDSLIEFVKDRPGHDRRYAIDSSKIRRDLGWEPEYTFNRGMAETIDWYCTNTNWWQKIKSGEYIEYYKRMYGL